MKAHNLGQLKYAELQKLAKKRGIKANLKTSDLIAALSKDIAEEEEENTRIFSPKNDTDTPGLLKNSTERSPVISNADAPVPQEEATFQKPDEQDEASEKKGRKTRKKTTRKGKRGKNKCNETVKDQTTHAAHSLSEHGDHIDLTMDKEEAVLLHAEDTEYRLADKSKTDIMIEQSMNNSISSADKSSAEEMVTDPVRDLSAGDCIKDQVKLEVIGQKMQVQKQIEIGEYDDVAKKINQNEKGKPGRKSTSINGRQTEASNDEEKDGSSLSEQHTSALNSCGESSFGSSKSVSSTGTIDSLQGKEHKRTTRQRKGKGAQKRLSAAGKAAAMSPVSAALTRGTYWQEEASLTNKLQMPAASLQGSTAKTTYLSPTVASLSKRARQKSAALFSPVARTKRSASKAVLENPLPQKKRKTSAEQKANGKQADDKESNSSYKTSRRSSERIQAKLLHSYANLVAESEAKKEILAEVEKNIQEKREKGQLPLSKDIAASHIPRFVAFTMGKSTTRNTPAGCKDWAKIHQKQFDKMESIDVYLAKKRKRNAELTASVKRAQQVAMATKQAMDKLTETVQKPFAPTITSVKKVNMNFAKIKSPAATDTYKAEALVAELSEKAPQTRKSVRGGAPVAKDVKAPTPQKKFDLQESLRRKLPYKPHAGKLKPLSSVENRQTAHAHKHPTNAHQQRGGVNSIRESGRQNLLQKRNNKRLELQMQRRQITA